MSSTTSPEILQEQPRIPKPGSKDKTKGVKVLYIGGQGRSGSTLLGRLLGQIDGYIHVGEVEHIWHQYRRSKFCGCGEPFAQCQFWASIVEHGYGSAENLDIDGMLALKHSLERTKTFHKLLFPLKPREQARQFWDYRNTLGTLYRSICEVAGARVIVDGSKYPTYGYVLQNTPGVDVRVVHLVRDSRAVAYSNQRQKGESDSKGQRLFLKTVGPVKTSAEWSIHNTLTEWFRPSGGRYLFMRYEDLIADPARNVELLCDWLHEPAEDLGFLSSAEIALDAQHNINGNPDRFNQKIKLRLDTEWIDRMAPKQRRLVTALTYPMLVKYGYRVQPEKGSVR